LRALTVSVVAADPDGADKAAGAREGTDEAPEPATARD